MAPVDHNRSAPEEMARVPYHQDDDTIMAMSKQDVQQSPTIRSTKMHDKNTDPPNTTTNNNANDKDNNTQATAQPHATSNLEDISIGEKYSKPL